jgi:hypothetical protein
MSETYVYVMNEGGPLIYTHYFEVLRKAYLGGANAVGIAKEIGNNGVLYDRTVRRYGGNPYRWIAPWDKRNGTAWFIQ